MLEPSNIEVKFPDKMIKVTPSYPEITINYKYVSLTEELQKKNDSNIFEIIWWLIKQSPMIIKLIKILVQIIESIKMKDWKTTVTVIVGAIAYICNLAFNIQIPQEAIIAVVVFVLGLLAKDSTKE